MTTGLKKEKLDSRSKPQAASGKRQAASDKLQAKSLLTYGPR
jgi:hypothetical protein